MKTILTLVAIALLAGCATKRYGRAQNLTVTERAEYSCRDIRIELSKVQAFEAQIIEGGRFDGKTVLGFLGDFGVGNGMEKRAAIKTARDRKEELKDLEARKQCNTQAAVEQRQDPPQ